MVYVVPGAALLLVFLVQKHLVVWVVWALCLNWSAQVLGGAIVYGVFKKTVDIRMGAEEEFDGADLSIHKIVATTDDWFNDQM